MVTKKNGFLRKPVIYTPSWFLHYVKNASAFSTSHVNKTAAAFTFAMFVSISLSGLTMSNNASAQEYDSENINEYVPNAKLVGKGMFSYYFWDVYTGELFASEGKYADKPPFALRLTYQRDLEGKKIAERSIDEMKKQGDIAAEDADKWLSLMERIFPDVSEGDVITGIATKEGTSVFYVNGEKADEISDKTFTQRFFDIWLSDETSEPKFRKKLLGKD
ncbi:chalcone isomerase family protein [Alteromonas sp. PRIM-21]|uniref:chalcone isomerase family protein n=1 Tax=Alteromonas sp. PRIM-21 TaxID=1454978 RepID=UPI0022B95C5A|nr:chalcone isomerase family protein [Alteromonas sp. PRIM-21]MCZ8528921.1 chalcone isomerase family protein [Alteromonas sp. PRIM-21]